MNEEADMVLSCQYALSKNSKCKTCGKRIEFKDLRIGTEVKSTKFDGPITKWHHLKCIQENIKASSVSTAAIKGFFILNADGRRRIEEIFGPAIYSIAALHAEECDGELAKKKVKEDLPDEENSEIIERLHNLNLGEKNDICQLDEQNLNRLKLQDSLFKLKLHEIKEILHSNRQYTRKRSKKSLVLLLADCMLYGALEKCRRCKYGQIEFKGEDYCYHCRGFKRIDGTYIKCQFSAPDPERKEAFLIPDKFRGAGYPPLLKDYKYQKKCLFYPVIQDSSNSIKRAAQTKKEQKEEASFFDTNVVDERSKLRSKADVFEDANGHYSKVLVKVMGGKDNKNSWYKLQLLKSMIGETYWVFRGWGRTATPREDEGTKYFQVKEDAIEFFKKVFKEKTGNDWENRDQFVPQPGKYQLHKADAPSLLLRDAEAKLTDKSKLKNEEVKKLVLMMNDIPNIKETLKNDFRINLNKLPLGLLLLNNVKKGQCLLSGIEKLIQLKDSNRDVLLAKSKVFYETIPHDFGDDKPPTIDSEEAIEEKRKLLNYLSGITHSYRTSTEKGMKDLEIDDKYKELNTDITVLDRKTQEYRHIIESVSNTHGKHGLKLTVLQIFKVQRLENENVSENKGKKRNVLKENNRKRKKNQGIIKEKERNEAKKKEISSNESPENSNKQLLWHGSPTTNYPGILKNGLRITPHEARRNAQRYGKGIYFADTVTKSAEYCMVVNAEALLLLCEVDLGKVHEQYEACENRTSPPKGCDSVKGVGTNELKNEYRMIDGVRICIGRPVSCRINQEQDYDEYVVYNTNRAKLKYIVLVNIVKTCNEYSE